MVATIVISILLGAYCLFLVVRGILKRRDSRKKGIPPGCMSCGSWMSGTCPGHAGCGPDKKPESPKN